MAYEKQTWQTGDVVTAAKLNNMENGIAGAGVLSITVTKNEDTYTMDKTWEEIKDLYLNGGYAYGVLVETFFDGTPVITIFTVSQILVTDGAYTVIADAEIFNTVEFKATSADGYPVYTNSGPQ